VPGFSTVLCYKFFGDTWLQILYVSVFGISRQDLFGLLPRLNPVFTFNQRL
jgi:hypothetical protein